MARLQSPAGSGSDVNFVDYLESTAIATFVRESPSILGYTLVLSLHAIGLAIVVGVSSIVGFRILGVARDIPLAPMAKLFPVMYLGFTINLISGLMLFAANASGMLGNFLFWIKIVFVFAAFVLMSLLYRHFDEIATRTMRGLARGMLGCWLVALIAGRLTAYPYFVRAWLGL